MLNGAQFLKKSFENISIFMIVLSINIEEIAYNRKIDNPHILSIE